MAPMTVVRRVTIADGHRPMSRAFAGLQLLPNGELVVCYRQGSDHLVTEDGAVMIVRSVDGGRTWRESKAVFAMPGWDCSGGNRVVGMPNGSLLMFSLQARWRHPINRDSPSYDSLELPDKIHNLMVDREAHTYPIRSDDGGHTWRPFGPELSLFGCWTEAAARARVHVGADGRWMIPAYGVDDPDSHTYAVVAFSSDCGYTWTDRSIIAIDPELNFHEADVLRREDGSLLAVIRSQDPPLELYQCSSFDDGLTWSPAARTGIKGQTPALIHLGSGAIACVFRDRDPERPGVSYSVSGDGGSLWTFGGRLYRARHWNCGYPDLVRLPTGEILCVYYTSYGVRGSAVRGVFLRDNTS